MITNFIGYHLLPGTAPEELDRWLRTTYAEQCLAQNSLSNLVFNKVKGTLRVDRSFYGVEERHFANLQTFEDFSSSAGLKDLEHASDSRRQSAFSVLTDVVSVDRADMDRMINEPSARTGAPFDQPNEKSVLGYDIVEGISVDDYEAWLWVIHTPDLFANPHLARVVYNTVIRSLDEGETFFRISELHIAEGSTFEDWADWRDKNPVPTDRSPLGRTEFRFFVRTAVEHFSR